MKSRLALGSLAGLVAGSLFIAGCGGGDDEEAASIVGTWTWSKVTINGITIDPSNTAIPVTIGGSTTITPSWITDAAAAYDVPGASVSITVTFNADGTLTATATGTAPGETPQSYPVTGTYSLTGDVLTFTIQGVTGTPTCSVTSSKLTLTITAAQVQQLVTDSFAAAGVPVPAEAAIFLGSLSGSVEFTR